MPPPLLSLPTWLSVFNAQPGATLLLSPDWIIVGASDDYLAATLTERAVLVGQFIFDAFPDNPDTPETNGVANVRASLEQVLATKEPHDMVPQHYDVPDPAQPGRFVERHWQPRHTPVLDAQGQVQFIIQSVQDITSRRVAQRQLRESQANEQTARADEQLARADAAQQRADFQYFIEQAPVAVAVYRGPEFRIALANATTLAIWDRSLDAVLHRPVFEVMPEAATPEIVALFERVFTTGTPQTLREQPTRIHRHGRPEVVYWNLVFEPQREPDGRVSGLFTIGTDVTAQVQARQQVEQLNQELEARVQERTQTALALQAEVLAAAQRQVVERQAFHNVFEQTPALVALLRLPGHRFDYVNPAYQALFPGRQLVGLAMAAAVPELREQGFVALLDQVYQTGETHFGTEVSFTAAQPDGERPTRFYNFTYQAYREAGAIAGISVFATDVTEQVRARQEREARQHQLREIFKQAPVAIGVFRGPEYVFDVVNPPMVEMLNRAEAQLLGLPFFVALPELANQGLRELLDGVRLTGEAFVAQEQEIHLARHGPGNTGFYTFVYQPLRDEHGQVAAITCVATDVTEQVRARRASERSAQQLRLLTDALPVLIGYLDQEQKYRFANEAYRAWFDQDPATLLGRPVREVVGERAYANVQTYIQRSLAGERLDFEAQMPYREGFTKHIRTSYIPDVQQGVVQGFYTLVADITDQVVARQQVQELNEELAAINEELTATNEELHESNTQLTRTNVDLDTFVYTASHDLKAPITNIESILLALRAELPAAVQQQEMVATLLAMLQGTVTRFQATITQLTDITQLQLAHAGPAEPVLLAPVVEAVRLDLAPLIAAADATLTVAVAPDLVVSFSPANLRSIVYNLLSNAVKYRSPDRPAQVRVQAAQTAAAVVLTVQDNGLVLSTVQQRQLFGLFQRLHTHVEGTGVGLYIVKRLVENGGGTITVQSQPDAGTTFTVTLPI